MRRPSQTLADRLDLQSSLIEECSSTRNQIPPEPWRAVLAAKPNESVAWIRSRLDAGAIASPQVVINARKASHGTRPVPIVGVEDRVVYRSLSKLILDALGLPDRSAAAYRDFIRGPIDHERSAQRSLNPAALTFNVLAGTETRYVVEADVAAFYQYVDHELLRHELEMHTGEIEAIELLIELLGEVEGRSFGLPQLLDASDWLSDIYIQVVERDLIRRGLLVWRYNDDFRISCPSYADALNALERLSEAARSVGLTLSDHKTFTPTFRTYFFRTTGREPSETLAALNPSDVDVIVTDYPDLDDDARASEAEATLARLELPSADERALSPAKFATEGLRDVRRAIAGLTALKRPSAIDKVRDLWRFAPSLVPAICEYLIAVFDAQTSTQVVAVTDALIETTAVGEWQALWLVHVIRRLDLLSSTSPRIEWVKDQRERGRGTTLGAEAALALADAGFGDFDDCETALRVEPDVLAPWHVLAMAATVQRAGNAEITNRARAVANSHPLHAILLGVS